MHLAKVLTLWRNTSLTNSFFVQVPGEGERKSQFPCYVIARVILSNSWVSSLLVCCNEMLQMLLLL